MAEGPALADEIMERLRAEAALSPRGARRLGTLRRLEEAATDIASGRARTLAEKAGMDGFEFGTARRPRINSETVGRYVHVRERLDVMRGVLDTEWTGPHPATIRGDQGLLGYLRAREAACKGFRRPKEQDTRVANIEQIVGTVPKDTDRIALMHALHDLYGDKARYQTLVKGVREVAGLDAEAILRQLRGESGPAKAKAETLAVLGPAEKIVLRGLLKRLNDESVLDEFGLRNDGRRVLMAHSPGTQLVQKAELELLQALAGTHA